MRIKKIVDDLLTMSKSEQNGALVLVVLLFLLIIFRFFVPHFFSDNISYQEDISEMIAAVEQQESDDNNKVQVIDMVPENVTSGKDRESSYVLPSASKSSRSEHPKAEVSFFTFDPNKVTKTELMKLGLTEKAATVFINYRSRGAVFYKTSDLLRVYSIDSAMYMKLEPYVSIPRQTNKSAINEKANTMPKVSLEINSADSALWTTLPGIGPVFASRICRFRNSLGGFVSIEQLKEVYNLSEERYEQIYSMLAVDTTKIIKIDLNFASLDDLKRHPYCTYETARKIVDYRAKSGSFQSVGALIADSLLTRSEFDKFLPYLQVQR